MAQSWQRAQTRAARTQDSEEDMIGSVVAHNGLRYSVTGYMTVGKDLLLLWAVPVGGGAEKVFKGKMVKRVKFEEEKA